MEYPEFYRELDVPNKELCTMPRKASSQLQQALSEQGIRTPPGKLRDFIKYVDQGITKTSQLIKLTAITRKTIDKYLEPKSTQKIRNILTTDRSATKAVVTKASNNKEAFSIKAQSLGINLPDDIIVASAGTIGKINSRKEGSTFEPEGSFLKVETKERVIDRKRYEDWKTAAKLVSDEFWNIAHLETIFPVTTLALGFLSEYDRYSAQLENSLRQSGNVVLRYDEYSNPEVHTKQDDPYLKSFDGYERYIEMHYENMTLTRYKKELDKHTNLNRGYFVTAKDLITQGVLDDDALLVFAGYGILRYEIWRGLGFREQYNNALDIRSGNNSNLRQGIHESIERNRTVSTGAEDGIRTRDPHLGKVMLYH